MGMQLDVHPGSSGPLPIPALSAGGAEDREGAAVAQRQLEVVPAQRLRRPPAVLDQPLLADGVDPDPLDCGRSAAGIGADRHPFRGIETAKAGHQSSG